ncbi:hypothetical protein [Leptolyngbya ohadii]|uniref:hypothetical protein n=1 Tax=Leptolyngbya ohadii TaxID=1962290 RepID=UPI0015C5D161|nr:hypothetical protein [Leptolyngbya ohadii]
MNLIYRGESFPYHPAPRISRQAQAINWRYQISDEPYTPSEPPIVSRQPQAVNWRYR